jgi:plastocyanin
MRLFSRMLAFVMSVATSASMLMPAAVMAANAPSGVFSPGDLIKGTSFSAVYYYASNGKRYVFPNEKTYFTWYTDFSGVRTLSDAQLGVIPIGGNVTYKPGVKMVKITTDPKVYAVDRNGILRHVASEELAETLYGLNWQGDIEDVPDAFFTNYRIGTTIEIAGDYVPADVRTLTPTIADDKLLDPTIANVSIGNKDSVGFVPTTFTIKKGTTVTWTNDDSANHRVQGTGFDSGVLTTGQTYSFKFNTVGSFDYSDSEYSTIEGTVNVVN